MRPLSLLLLCLALAGCAANAASDVTGSTTAHNAYARAQANEDWWKEGGVTREKINAMCWMKYEKGRADVSLDKRADLVNACVAETRKQYPLAF